MFLADIWLTQISMQFLMVGVVPERRYNVQLSNCNFLKLTNANSWATHCTLIKDTAHSHCAERHARDFTQNNRADFMGFMVS